MQNFWVDVLATSTQEDQVSLKLSGRPTELPRPKRISQLFPGREYFIFRSLIPLQAGPQAAGNALAEHFQEIVEQDLAEKMVFLTGPRQVGKTGQKGHGPRRLVAP
jgi:hypothetical protein